jgi:hypothetical protein
MNRPLLQGSKRPIRPGTQLVPVFDFRFDRDGQGDYDQGRQKNGAEVLLAFLMEVIDGGLNRRFRSERNLLYLGREATLALPCAAMRFARACDNVRRRNRARDSGTAGLRARLSAPASYPARICARASCSDIMTT